MRLKTATIHQKTWLDAADRTNGAERRRPNSLIAFIIIIAGMTVGMAVMAIVVRVRGQTITNNNNRTSIDSTSAGTLPGHREGAARVALMLNVIVISAKSTTESTSPSSVPLRPPPAPSAVNKNSLQTVEVASGLVEQRQYQIQVDEDAKDAEGQMALKPPHSSTSRRINVSDAKGNTTITSNNSAQEATNDRVRSSNNAASTTVGHFVASADVRNGFRDKINISNQRNEFNAALNTRRPTTTPTTPSPAPAPPPAPKQDQASSSELLQPETPPNGGGAQHELVLLRPHHRQKRYLLFPEGSSFQLVFDLIIPIVDYTNFAIMGITCAVAWELPSKPPSEIIANFREKLNDGTFGLSRRNDSASDRIKYVDNAATGDDAAADDALPGQVHYGDRGSSGVVDNPKSRAQMSATVVGATAAPAADAATSDVPNYENGYRNPLATLRAPPRPSLTPSPAYSNYYREQTPAVDADRPRHAQRPLEPNFYAFNDDDNKRWKSFQPTVMAGDAAALRVSGDVTDDDDGAANEHDRGKYSKWRTHTKSYAKYYKNKNGGSGTSGYASADKQKFPDWQHQPQPQSALGQQPKQPSKTKYAYEYEGRNKLYQKARPTAADIDEFGGGGAQNNDVYGAQVASGTKDWNAAANWQQDNWWARNEGRVRENWREQQRAWTNTEATARRASQGSSGAPRPGVARKMLETPLPHRVYPIFGKRRRREWQRQQPQRRSLNPFEWKLEQIHLLEHLQTRQRLYGKIEKLYKVRGHNGTACLLRALCETGQQQQQEQAQQQYREEHQTEPQSFMMELLRAIFTLPRDMHAAMARPIDAPLGEEDQREPVRHHIDTHYVEAHAYTGDCARRYALCEHSIWRDFQYEI